MLPSTSLTACIPNKEVVRDAALCLRSFCGERQSIPYSKFCERFKKVIGYSLKIQEQTSLYHNVRDRLLHEQERERGKIEQDVSPQLGKIQSFVAPVHNLAKEHLQTCGYTFAEVIEQISTTTRTKCRYDAELKMVQLLSDEAPDVLMSSPGFYSDVSFYHRPYNADAVPHFYPTFPYTLQVEPQMKGTDVLESLSVPASGEDIVSVAPVQYLQDFGCSDTRSSCLHGNDSDVIDGNQLTDDGAGIDLPVALPADVVTGDSLLLNDSLQIESSSKTPWSTADMFGGDTVDLNKSDLYGSCNEDYDGANEGELGPGMLPAPWSNSDLYDIPPLPRGREEETPSTSHFCMEQVHQSLDEVETISSSVDKVQEESSCYHSREVGDYDDSFYDAQDAFSSQKVSHGYNLSTGNWKGSADLSFTDRSQPLSSASRTSEEFFEASSTLPHFCRKKSHSVGNLNYEDLFFGRPSGSALEVRFCDRLTFGLLDGQPHHQEYPPEKLREEVIRDLKEGSRHTAPFWLKNRKPLCDTSIPKWRGFSRGKFAEGSAPNDLCGPRKMEERKSPVSNRQGSHDQPCENSVNSAGEEEIVTVMRETKQVRAEAKSLCLKQWGDRVRNLSELLWFLQVFYRVNGSVLITECEEMIESCIEPLGGDEGFSWKRYGRHMDVKRMFELKMFRLSAPPNRMKVQPVDCILNVGFRIVQKGLASELYKIVAKVGKITIDDVDKHLEPFLHGLSERNRKDEIRAALKKLTAVVRKVGSRLELEDSEKFFVVTDVD